jgi:hypothetical protein
MNSRERKVMEVVYAVVNRMSGMGPSNPADLHRKGVAFDRMSRASGKLVLALSSMQSDLDDALEHANEALQEVGVTSG